MPIRSSPKALGRTIPTLLVLAFFLDMLLRPLPLDSLTFRAWEAAARYRGPGGPFEPNKSYRNEKAYGDLAAMANLSAFREYRSEFFSTDKFGFRNSPASSKSWGSIIVGDSFAGGAGLSDHETYSAALARILGQGVYNAGATSPSLAVVDEVASRENIETGFLFYQHLERSSIPSDQMVKISPRTHYVSMDPSNRRRLYRLIGFAKGLLTSPLQVGIQRSIKELHNDIVFPNIYASSVVQKNLRNGEKILFLPDDVAPHHISIERAIAYWKPYSEGAKSLGLKLVVVLIPTKYSVYAPLLSPPEQAETNLPEVSRALRTAGIEVVDLSSTFQIKAAELLEEDQYLYWLDDTHWNPKGTEVAAKTTWEVLESKPQQAAPSPSKEARPSN